jgi:hypothetical protein
MNGKARPERPVLSAAAKLTRTRVSSPFETPPLSAPQGEASGVFVGGGARQNHPNRITPRPLRGPCGNASVGPHRTRAPNFQRRFGDLLSHAERDSSFSVIGEGSSRDYCYF